MVLAKYGVMVNGEMVLPPPPLEFIIHSVICFKTLGGKISS